jgi:Secretion system C-terminal sorting domain/Domain of unknown function (DUF4886)
MKTELEETGRAFLLLGIITALFMLVSSFVHGQTTKVLFLGNSFTYTYDIPSLFEGMASNAGESILVDEYTQAGIAVYDDQVQGHINDASAQAKISSEQWDYVVVQDNMGGWVYDYILGTPGNANVTLYNQIKANNQCTRIIYFSAWGPEGGVPGLGYSGESTVSCNNRIYSNWTSFNDQASNEIVSPVGKSWNQSLSDLPSVDLFYSDNVHPSLEGSYLAALTIYTSIFKKDPNNLTYNGGVSAATANSMKTIAWDIVMDPTIFNECNLDDFTPLVSQSGDDLSTSGYSSYQWYLNGSPIAGATSSTYTATQIGSYTVVGFDANTCASVSFEFEVTTISGNGGGASITEGVMISINVYPNPANEELNIYLANEEIELLSIHDVSGKLVYQAQNITNSLIKIQVSDWENGIYIISLINDMDETRNIKLIVQ